jgi:hypothetical protein
MLAELSTRDRRPATVAPLSLLVPECCTLGSGDETRDADCVSSTERRQLIANVAGSKAAAMPHARHSRSFPGGS